MSSKSNSGLKKWKSKISGKSAGIVPVNIFLSIEELDGKEVVRVTKDPKSEFYKREPPSILNNRQEKS